jgi:hypothetical protein
MAPIQPPLDIPLTLVHGFPLSISCSGDMLSNFAKYKLIKMCIAIEQCVCTSQYHDTVTILLGYS